MPKCPNGHDSTWEDFCSKCGEAISVAAGGGGDAGGPGASAGGGAGSDEPNETTSGSLDPDQVGLSCANCGDTRSEMDVFCESCGYDFASGTLPSEEEESSALPGAAATGGGTSGDETNLVPAPDVPPTGATAAPGSPPVPDGAESGAVAGTGTTGGAPTGAATTVAVITVDKAFFDRVAAGGELQFPDPEPAPVRIPLNGSEILIGRRSDSRGIYPEIDLSPPMDDPAVSHRHALLALQDDGSWTVTDLDSTNGSYLADHTVAMVPSKTKPFPLATPLYVGAYTKVTLEEA